MEIEIGIEVEIETTVAFCTDVVQKEEAGDLTILAESSTLAGTGLPRNGCDLPPALPRTLVQGIFPQWRAKGDRWE